MRRVNLEIEPVAIFFRRELSNPHLYRGFDQALVELHGPVTVLLPLENILFQMENLVKRRLLLVFDVSSPISSAPQKVNLAYF